MSNNLELNEKIEKIEQSIIDDCEDISPLKSDGELNLDCVESVNSEGIEMSTCPCTGGCGSNFSTGNCPCTGNCGSNFHKG